MPTPKQGYRLADGTRVPSVTTIIGRYKDSEALKHYWYQQGLDGKPLYEHSQKAADVGTCAHAMVEKSLRGETPDEIAKYLSATLPVEMRHQALSAYNAYENWKKNFGVEIIEQEIQLVSEKYRYGGTPDAIGMVGNHLVLLDWKTSNAIYEDYLYQLAAYKNLWEENRPQAPITGGFHLLRFSKDKGDFSHHFFSELHDEWEQFKRYREAYETSKRTKKRAA